MATPRNQMRSEIQLAKMQQVRGENGGTQFVGLLNGQKVVLRRDACAAAKAEPRCWDLVLQGRLMPVPNSAGSSKACSGPTMTASLSLAVETASTISTAGHENDR